MWAAVRHDWGLPREATGCLSSKRPWEGVPRRRDDGKGEREAREHPWLISEAAMGTWTWQRNTVTREGENECSQSRSCHCLCENKRIMLLSNALDKIKVNC